MHFTVKYACIYFFNLTCFYWLPDVPISIVVLVSVINGVYRINCQMLVVGKKGRLSIASKSAVVLKNNNYNKERKRCVLQDAI